MKNTTMLYIIGLMILIVGGFVFFNGDNKASAEIATTNGEVIKGQTQQVVLSQDGYNYKDGTAEAGKSIILSADNSVRGCLRSVVFNVEGKKYSKYLRTPEDTLDLPALPKGTYSFSCTMGMGYGKLVVK